MDDFRPENATCPVCGSTGNCHPHAYYDRFIIDCHGGTVSQERLHILRLYCTSCRHTHAVLPDFIIPYSTYGITFLLRVLLAYFTRSRSNALRTVEEICCFFGISPRLLYRWLVLFVRHKYQWLGALCDSETSESEFINGLSERDSFSEFLAAFFHRMGVSFLQNHRNPLQENPKGAHSDG